MARGFDKDQILKYLKRAEMGVEQQFTIYLGSSLSEKFASQCNYGEWTFTQTFQFMVETFLAAEDYDISKANKRTKDARPNQNRRLGLKCHDVITCSLKIPTAKAFLDYCLREELTRSEAGKKIIESCIQILEKVEN